MLGIGAFLWDQIISRALLRYWHRRRGPGYKASKYMENLLKYFGIVLLASVLILTNAIEVNGQSIAGRFSTSVYNWERQDSDSTSSTHLLAYQIAKFDIRGYGTKNLSVHTYIKLSTDLATESPDDPRYAFYNLYAKYKLSKSTKISIGRQRIFSGTG